MSRWETPHQLYHSQISFLSISCPRSLSSSRFEALFGAKKCRTTMVGKIQRIQMLQILEVFVTVVYGVSVAVLGRTQIRREGSTDVATGRWVDFHLQIFFLSVYFVVKVGASCWASCRQFLGQAVVKFGASCRQFFWVFTLSSNFDCLVVRQKNVSELMLQKIVQIFEKICVGTDL